MSGNTSTFEGRFVDAFEVIYLGSKSLSLLEEDFRNKIIGKKWMAINLLGHQYQAIYHSTFSFEFQ